MKIKNLLVGIWILLIGCIGVMGQIPKMLPQISSKDLLRIDAFRQSAEVESSIVPKLEVDDRPQGRYVALKVGENNSLGISNAIASLNLSVSVINPRDYLRIGASVRNADGDTLFSGSKSFKLLPPSDTRYWYSLPEDYSKLELELNYNPIKIPGLVQAYFIPFREDGTSDTDNVSEIYTHDEKAYYPPYFAGANGLFLGYVNVKGGQIACYWNVLTGGLIPNSDLSAKAEVFIKGIKPFVDQDVDVVIDTQNRYGESITAELHITETSTRSIWFRTSEKGGGHWFSGLWLVDSVTGARIPYATKEGLANIPVVELKFEPGVYYLIPVFGSDELIDPDQIMVPSTPVDGIGAEN